MRVVNCLLRFGNVMRHSRSWPKESLAPRTVTTFLAAAGAYWPSKSHPGTQLLDP
jgi:hypothetical protein